MLSQNSSASKPNVQLTHSMVNPLQQILGSSVGSSGSDEAGSSDANSSTSAQVPSTNRVAPPSLSATGQSFEETEESRMSS